MDIWDYVKRKCENVDDEEDPSNALRGGASGYSCKSQRRIDELEKHVKEFFIKKLDEFVLKLTSE